MHSVVTTTPNLQGDFARALPYSIVQARRSAPLSALRILGNALLIVAMLMLNVAGTIGAAVFFAILGAMLLISPEAAFKALAICFLGLMINSFFVPKSLIWTPARIALPFLALLRFGVDLAAYRLSLFSRASFTALLFFCGAMALCSIASGWYTHIALLKITYFLTYLTVIFAAVAVIRHRRTDIGEWIVSLILAATLFGVGAIVLNVDSNFRPTAIDMYGRAQGSGFNGAFGHPNVHSVYGTLFVAFLGIVWLLSTYRERWLVLPLMACWGAFIFWSASRTALLACGMTVLMTVVLAKPLRNRFGWRMRPHIRRRTLLGLLALVAVTGLFWDASTGNSLRNQIASYLVKGRISNVDVGEQLSVERVIESRRSLVEFSWMTFLDNPIFGVGFGVSKTEAFRRTATYFTAPVEKGFLPTAILEEGGLVGTSAFVLFIGVFVWDLTRQRNIAGLITFIAFLASNLGEVTIFAPGGAGAFGWLMIGAAMILNDRCWIPSDSRAPIPTGCRAR